MPVGFEEKPRATKRRQQPSRDMPTLDIDRPTRAAYNAPGTLRVETDHRYRNLSLNSFSLSVCMPAYNEEANLPGMIADVVAIMQARFDDFEIVVTNDGSKDRTGEVLQALAAQYPQLKPVDHAVNQGYGAAVFTALSNAGKDVIFFTDSDRQFKLEEIDLLVPHLAEADHGGRLPLAPARSSHARALRPRLELAGDAAFRLHRARHRLRLQAAAADSLRPRGTRTSSRAGPPSAPNGWCSPSAPASASPRCRSATCRARLARRPAPALT
jgi:hypothetical protein